MAYSTPGILVKTWSSCYKERFTCNYLIHLIIAIKTAVIPSIPRHGHGRGVWGGVWRGVWGGVWTVERGVGRGVGRGVDCGGEQSWCVGVVLWCCGALFTICIRCYLMMISITLDWQYLHQRNSCLSPSLDCCSNYHWSKIDF